MRSTYLPRLDAASVARESSVASLIPKDPEAATTTPVERLSDAQLDGGKADIVPPSTMLV
jgi:hypothetical protein